MRPVLIDDLLVLTAYLEPMPEQARRAAVGMLCDKAHSADHLRKRLGRSVSAWGNGSLNAAVNAMTRAGRAPEEPQAGAGVGSEVHLRALRAAVDGVLVWKAGQAGRGGRTSDPDADCGMDCRTGRCDLSLPGN